MNIDPTFRRALRWAAVGELSSRVAHETNNLLAGILGQAELGLLSNDPARMKLALESIVRSSRELKTVTERLLIFSKQMEQSVQNANLLDVFRSLFGLLERGFTKAGVHVESRFGEIPSTWCDPGGMAPAQFFVLRFALETLREAGGGNLVLEADARDGEIVFRVRILPSKAARLEPSQGRAGDLTLEHAKDLARHEGGSLRIERDGTGWIATTSFPIRKSPESLPEAREGGKAKAAPGARATSRNPALSMLVVEDELPIRDLIREVLEESGCVVTAKADARAALAAFGAGHFDAVLTDIMMPGMDGVTLVRKLRALDPGAVVVVVTGRATDESVCEVLEAGAKVVLRKPFELSDLKEIVRTLRADPSGASLQDPAKGHRDTVVI